MKQTQTQLMIGTPTEQMPGRWFAYIYQGEKTFAQVFGATKEEVEERAGLVAERSDQKAGAAPTSTRIT